MGFLYPGRALRSHRDADARCPLQRAAACAGKPDRRKAHRAGLLHRRDDVRRIAAGRDAERDVPSFSQRLQLTREDDVVTVVVGERRQCGGVRCQREGRYRPSLFHEPPDQLSHYMLAVGGAAAVAEDDYLAAASDRRDHQLGRLFDIAHLLPEDALFYADRLFYSFRYDCFHRFTRIMFLQAHRAWGRRFSAFLPPPRSVPR